MPAYDFKCNSCGNRFTVRVPVQERKNVKCPLCGQGQLTQLLTSINILGAGRNGCDVPLGSRFT
ncbi:MAG: zinc ribbon domain-containing protein [Clostridia bacterium]|jgi:putative FmdB family regulatory protein|nr:zinc ribbon domain-containing protein [Clostridia bacterium]